MLPGLQRLMLDYGSGRGSDVAIRVTQIWPSFVDGIWMVAYVIGFQHSARCLQFSEVAFFDCWRRRLAADVCDAVQTALDAAAANREVHGAVDWVDDNIGERQRSSGHKTLQLSAIRGAVRP